MHFLGAPTNERRAILWPRFRWRTQLNEQRKFAILFAATILAARKLHEIGSKPCPARECAIADAISNAELILKKD
jgi:hypothetical protein